MKTKAWEKQKETEIEQAHYAVTKLSEVDTSMAAISRSSITPSSKKDDLKGFDFVYRWKDGSPGAMGLRAPSKYEFTFKLFGVDHKTPADWTSPLRCPNILFIMSNGDVYWVNTDVLKGAVIYHLERHAPDMLRILQMSSDKGAKKPQSQAIPGVAIRVANNGEQTWPYIAIDVDWARKHSKAIVNEYRATPT